MEDNGLKKQADNAKNLGIAGLITAAASFITICSRSLSLFLIVAAVILCVIGMMKANQTNTSKTLHTCGLVIVGLRIIVMVLFVIIGNKVEKEFSEFMEKQDSLQKANSAYMDSISKISAEYDSTTNSYQLDSSFYLHE